jgi:hypothetical protein
VVRVLTLLVGRRPFMAGNPWEWPAVVLTALALWGLLVAAWRRGRPAAPTPGPALGWLLVLATAVVLLIPSRLGDDFGYLADRAAWFPVLLLLLWAATRLPGRRAAVAIGAALLVAGCGLVVARLPAQTAASREVDEVMSVAPELPRGAAFVVLRYVKAPPGHLAPDPLRHVSSRLATRTGGVDIGHYEAVTAYFQVTFDGGPDLRRRLDPSATGLERVPPAVDLAAVRGRLDYVLVVGLDRATPAARHAARTLAVQRELETYYRRVATSAATGLVTVWRATPQPEVSVP